MNEQLLTQWAQRALNERPHPSTMFPPSPYYRFLKILAEKLQPALSVELGVCGGGGSLHLAQGYPLGRVVGIDISNDYPDNMLYIRQNHANFTLLLGDSIELAKRVYEDYGPVDILFIDTTHTYEQTLAEYEAWRPYLSERAVVCFDDLFRPGMEDAWNELPSPKLRLDTLHDGAEDGGGFGIIWKA